MDLSYRVNPHLESKEVIDLFQKSGIRRPTNDNERIGKMLANANLTVCAYDGARLVGVARALTDFSYCCYLSDLAVLSAYQRQGIGKELIKRIHEIVGEEVMILLVASPEANSYYPHIGFQKVETAWIIPRKR